MGDTGKPTGVWFEELTTPYYTFVNAGYQIEIVSIAATAKTGARP
jgi:putative intracellular protease/amidase